jgi:hypothetical protein
MKKEVETFGESFFGTDDMKEGTAAFLEKERFLLANKILISVPIMNYHRKT